ncbi:MAG: hypothetical protein QOJ35_1013 [Solirubrobacteraceae bacterium]|jgi:hypothetical protein|nr:hypothetical protein [Solirubrobacteraceae bacterium]
MIVNHRTMGERMRPLLAARCVAVVALTCALGVAAGAVGASPAYAGLWMRTTCLNPDRSTAPSDGWTSFTTGVPSVGSTNRSTCTADSPMIAFLSTQSPAREGSAEVLQYTPPPGSTLVGGTAFVGLSADGYGAYAAGTAAMFTPAYDYDPSNVFLQCVAKLALCQNGVSDYYGTVELPHDRGGNLYVAAGCKSEVRGTYCTRDGSHGAWSLVAVSWANLLLSTTALPTAAEFRGSLLEPGAHGTAGLAFSVADGGPGVYKVIVTIDDKPVYNATPNSNAGKCVPAGIDPGTGAYMWSWQQPCLQSQIVDLTIRTTTLTDGPHELKVVVQNAALNASTVLRRAITTNNRTTVSATLTSDRPASAGLGALAPVYAVVLDAPTQALVGGVRRGWTRSALALSGTLRNSAGVPAPGVLVTLFAQSAGQGETAPVARTTTDAAGHWVLPAPQGPSRILTIAYGEQPDPASPLAIKIRETVKPAVSLHVRALGGGRLRFSGRVGIAPLGTPRPLVVIQTRNGKHWQAVGTAIRVRPSGAYSIIYDGGPNVIGGSYVFRTVAHATALFATGISPIRRAVVR